MRSAPTCVSTNHPRIDFFYIGADDAMWHGSFDGTEWTKAKSLGGILTSAPAACSWGQKNMNTFIRGTDDAMYHKYFIDGKWSEWENLAGKLESSPACTAVKD